MVCDCVMNNVEKRRRQRKQVFMDYLEYIASDHVRLDLFHDLFSLFNKPKDLCHAVYSRLETNPFIHLLFGKSVPEIMSVREIIQFIL